MKFNRSHFASRSQNSYKIGNKTKASQTGEMGQIEWIKNVEK